MAEVADLTAGTDWGLHSLFEYIRSTAPGRGSGGDVRAQLLAKGLTESDLADVLQPPAQKVAPLEPEPQRTPLDLDELAQLFTPQGALANTFKGYEQRPQQVQMMRKVAEAFNDGKTLLVEAGTGTGKSLAYLAPVARWALQNGERVVISTDTINLQDQLYNKDVPDVRRAFGKEGEDLKAVLVKGRSNYLCLTRWRSFRRNSDHSPDEVRFIAKVLLWLPNTRTGDVAELPLTADERTHWTKVCATIETCTGRRCQGPNGRQCFLYRARQEAEGAHLVLVNHSLLLSDIAADNAVLPGIAAGYVDPRAGRRRRTSSASRSTPPRCKTTSTASADGRRRSARQRRGHASRIYRSRVGSQADDRTARSHDRAGWHVTSPQQGG
ncbi:MAG: DEAD/DEAH box helicase [Chloroflexia bacterium]